jgi:hypothetical protein
MAQSGFTPISLYYSTTAAAAPIAANLITGELAINVVDGKLYYKDLAGVVQVIAGKGGAGVAAGSNTQVQFNSSGSLAGSANLTFNGTTLTAGGLATSGLTSLNTLNIASTVNVAGATASQALFTDASKNVVSNAITGTGNVVMSASPTLTGTINAAAITASGTVGAATLTASGTVSGATVTASGTVSGATVTSSGAVNTATLVASGDVTGNGNWIIGNADTDTVTLGASFVNGTTLKSAKTATNTLALAAYDVDGASYTNLITLTASNTPTLALTSTGVGTINNMSIGATTASTGTFSTLTTASAAITGGSINGTTIGATTASTGTFTTLTSSSAAITGGTINGTSVGATTASTGAFTNFTVSGTASFTSTGAVKVPVGTTAQQPSPTTGMIRYNSSNGQFEGYYASTWGQIGGGATGGGGNQVFVLNDQTVTVDYTIPTGKNASSAGPITIDTGITVTVPTDSTWVIV